MRLDDSRTSQSDLDAAAASLAAMSFVELHESDYSDIEARRDRSADLSSDSEPDSESEDEIITSEQFESALDSDSDSDLGSQPDSDSGSISASDDIPMAYNPEALHESFKSLALINQIRHSKKFKMKLDRSQAAILYAFALFFCLNGPVGFNTEVFLKFTVDLPDSTINVKGMYSIRQVFGRKLTHLMFSEYVVAVKRALPQNISCPMFNKYGDYFPCVPFMMTHLDNVKEFGAFGKLLGIDSDRSTPTPAGAKASAKAKKTKVNAKAGKGKVVE